MLASLTMFSRLLITKDEYTRDKDQIITFIKEKERKDYEKEIKDKDIKERSILEQTVIDRKFFAS